MTKLFLFFIYDYPATQSNLIRHLFVTQDQMHKKIININTKRPSSSPRPALATGEGGIQMSHTTRRAFFFFKLCDIDKIAKRT